MPVQIIEVPYDSGSRNQRMGQGPLWFVENGVVEKLREKCGTVEEVIIDSQETFTREIGTTFELYRLIAIAVRKALSERAFPLMLAGNCNSTVGAISGLCSENLGVIWFDAHGDFNTPETSTSGFLDAMGVSMMTGRCWRPMLESIPGYRPLPDERVVLVGARDFDETEFSRLESSGIALVKYENIRELGAKKAMEVYLDTLSKKVNEVYVHVDMDVHDAELAPANLYKPKGGLTPEEVREAVHTISNRFHICAAAVTAFDPDADEDNNGLKAGLELVTLFGEIAVKQQRYLASS